MAFKNIDAWLPSYPSFIQSPSFSSAVVDADGERIAHMGFVTWPEDGSTTKDIARVQFRFSTVTKTSGMAVKVSLQDISTAAGPPIQPDGTIDQSVVIANADATLASNTWCRTGTLSANRTVSLGTRLAVVWEFNAARAGTDLFQISAVSDPNVSQTRFNTSGVALLSGGVWTLQSAHPNVLLEFTDGTFGMLSPGIVASTVTTTSGYNSGSTPDEYALRFQVPFECVVDGAYVIVGPAAGSNFDVALYAGTTLLQSATVDPEATQVIGSRFHFVTFPATTLTAGTTYYLSAKPTTATNIQLAFFDVSSASHLAAMPGGVEFYYATRTDGGAWSAGTTTRRPFAGIHLRQVAETASVGTQTLTPSLFTDGDTFHAPTVTTGAVSLTPSLFTDGDTFHAPTVTRGAVTLSPTPLTEGDTFYSATVTRGAVTLSGNLFTDPDTFYGPTIGLGAVILAPALFTDGDTFHAPTVTRGAVSLSPSLFTDGDTFLPATITQGAPGETTLLPALFTDGDTFHAATITTGAVTVSAPFVTNTQSIYGPVVSTGAVTISPPLVTNTNGFFTAVVSFPGEGAVTGGRRSRRHPRYPFLKAQRPLEPIEGELYVVEEGQDSFEAVARVIAKPVLDAVIPKVRGEFGAPLEPLKPIPVSGILYAQERGCDSFFASGKVEISGEIDCQEAGPDQASVVGVVSWETEDERAIHAFINAMSKAA